MVKACAAYGCSNRYSIGKEISFHKIPKHDREKIRKKWLNNIRRDGNLPKD